MKKTVNILLILSVIISCFMCVTVSADTYDTSWTMTVRNQDEKTDSFAAGDIIEVNIVNSNALASVTDAVIKFTFNSDLLEYASADEALAIMGAVNTAVCGLESDNKTLDASYEELNTAGLFRGAFATGTDNGASITAGQSMYKVYFKVKTTIPEGISSLNFRWIHTGDDKSYVANGDANYNIQFVDVATTVNGDELSTVPDKLPSTSDAERAYIFAPTVNPTSENPEQINLNGQIVTVTTPYVVVFSKLVPYSSEYVEAGIMISETENANMQKGDAGVYYARAEKFTSDNHFGVLFYGEGVKAETTYYARARVEYSDKTLYSDMLSVTTAE